MSLQQNYIRANSGDLPDQLFFQKLSHKNLSRLSLPNNFYIRDSNISLEPRHLLNTNLKIYTYHIHHNIVFSFMEVTMSTSYFILYTMYFKQ